MKLSKANVKVDNYIQVFNSSFSERPNYKCTADEICYSQVAIQVLGCLEDECEYFTTLYELVNGSLKVYLLTGKLDRTIDQNIFQFLQRLFEINASENGLSVNRLVAFLEGEKLIPEGNAIYKKNFIREKFKNLLLYFKERYGDFLNQDFRRILVDIIKWQKNYIEKWFQESLDVPKVVWYGNLSKSEEYFLHYLVLLGFDILYFNPEGNALEFDLEAIRLPNKIVPSEFPKERPIRNKTVAYNASLEIDKILYKNTENMLYKPWQLRDFKPQAIILKTTYDEIFILSKARAFIRPGFSVEGQQVFIPTLFAKIHGISSQGNEYWKAFNELKNQEQTLLYTQFPITKEVISNPHFHYQNCLGIDGELCINKIMDLPIWSYKKLPACLQKGMANTLIRCIKKVILKPEEELYQTKLYLFNQFMNLPEDVVKLLQQFDYSQIVPKIIIFNSGKTGNLSRSDAALLIFLSTFGVDVIIFNPTGQNDVEIYINSDHFENFYLDKFSFNEEIKERSIKNKFLKFFT